MMPGSSGGTNPMMPGGSMTGTSSGTRTSAGSGGSNPAAPSSSPLDPLGAMSGGAQKFSGGSSLMDPMGFMGGGGLTGNMSNMFSLTGKRAIDLFKGMAKHNVKTIKEDNGLVGLLAGSVAYNEKY
ncbi:uncharacterized protein LOC132713645 [Ruditapes philippinarum]|uniref:uncharacterized protein LOC132713645 n=1 Tax=Ruditapes philippinarum TaxID=129788 RepID=UPI00295AEA88|nr:uncharacterized protein LOC132713645 [Ruditapes philippinarum]